MKVYIAEALPKYPLIELLTLKTGLFQTPITEGLIPVVRNFKACDIVLVPHDAYHFHSDVEYLEYLNSISDFKLVLYSDRGDFPKRPLIERGISLRVSIDPGENVNNKVVIPYNVQSLDFLPFQEYRPQPIVTFVGYVPRISLGRIMRSTINTPLHPLIGNGAIVRRKAIKDLERSGQIHTIVARDFYGASMQTNNDLEGSRSEFLDVMKSSDYVLTPRGDANQSARFYETLSSGRVPVIPQSKIVFPKLIQTNSSSNYHFIKTYTLSKSNELGKLLKDDWSTISSRSAYLEKQKQIRKFFKISLSFNNYVRDLFKLELSEFLKVATYSAKSLGPSLKVES